MKNISKKILSLIILIFLVACNDDIPDGIIITSLNDYKIVSVNAPDSAVIGKEEIITSLEFNNSPPIKKVYSSVFSADGKRDIVRNISLYDNGKSGNGDKKANDNIYSATIKINGEVPIGKYQIKYFITDITSKTKLAATKNILLISSQKNVPPVISNLILADTLTTGKENPFTIYISVSDENGYKDIKEVKFNLYDEQNALMATIDMYDDGNISLSGDKTAGDGIFSFKNSFTETAKGKTRTFKFWATDISKQKSNVITKKVYIK